MKSTPENISIFQHTLLDWWAENGRDFPWRHKRTIYRTAIAELMLRRTQASQVVPVYEAYIAANPTIETAADASSESTETLLYPLGLRWRTQNVIDFVQEARAKYGSDLPTDMDELKSLPGVGDYVGAAIACFAGGQPVPLVDTNVARVLGRVFGVRYSGEARRRREIKDIAAKCVPTAGPAEYHYAILDFAAVVCSARKPDCTKCPFSISDACEYYRNIAGMPTECSTDAVETKAR